MKLPVHVPTAAEAADPKLYAKNAGVLLAEAAGVTMAPIGARETLGAYMRKKSAGRRHKSTAVAPAP